MFAGQAPKHDEPWRAAAFLRAALAEYCSIEEVQKADRPSGHFKLSTSTNPLLHLLELMRHLNIHVKTVQTTSHSINVQFGQHTSDMNVYIVTDLAATDLAQLKNGKHYALADLGRSVDWFNSQQLHWGAGDLITQGTTLFAASLCTHYGL